MAFRWPSSSWSRAKLPNIALRVLYDGTRFAGFQRQVKDRTIQGELEEVLQRLTGQSLEELRLTGAGRTDAGVHASGQVVNFKTSKEWPLDRWVSALNALLPDDVAIEDAQEVPPDFHARFSAIARSYRYVVLQRATPDPLRRFTTYRPRYALPKLASMQGAWERLVGTHDFAAFGSTGSNPRGTIITVLAAECRVEDEEIIFDVAAKSFLYHMVRRLVGTALEVGKGALDVGGFTCLYQQPNPPLAGPTAPARGLTLTDVHYPPPIGWGRKL